MKKNTFKKAIAVLLAAVIPFGMVGCAGNKKQEAPTEAPTEEVTSESSETESAATVGGWTVNLDIEPCAIDETAKEAFDMAMEGYLGVDLEPVAVLGTQVVSGTNYAFLCKETPVTANPETTISVAIVYAALDGKAEIRNVEEINIADYVEDGEIEFNPADFAGGWTASDDVEGKLPDDVQVKFDKAMEGLVGVDYTPVAELGTQVVAGENIAILCRATAVTPDPVSALSVVTIYADLNGNAEVHSICGFDIADFNK